MPPPEPQLQAVTPELSSGEKVRFITENALAIGREKAKLSPYTNGLTLSTIADRLRLSSVIPKPDEVIARMNISLPSSLPARRKAEVVTVLAAGTLLHEKGDPGNLEAAALLLTTNYPIQADLLSVMDHARRQDNGEGARADLQLISERSGHTLERQVKQGKVDRLLATTISEFAFVRGLTPQAATELARSIVKNETPSTIHIASLVPEVRIVYSIARALRNAQSRAGLSDPKLDVPFAAFSRVSIRSLEQTYRLRSPLERRKLLSELIEGGKIPDKIESLGDILRIVDDNPEIRAVSFDLYDTLVQWTEDFADRYGRYPHRALKHFQKVGINISEGQLRPINDAVWHERWANFQAHGTEVPLDNTINDLINRVSQGKSLSTTDRYKLHHLLTREWYNLELENAVVMPGARETLDQLKARGIKVALTSNASWSMHHVQRVLNRFGLLEYFDTISISSDIGKMKKPNIPDFFHHSWDKLGLPYETILHVGDNPNDDVLGARNAGARSTHYNNPLAYNRLEIDKVHGGTRFMRESDQQLYAETVVHMQRQSLESSTYEWIVHMIRRKKVPEVEGERTMQLAHEIYTRTRDIYAPVYINMADQLLQQLNSGETDVIFALARDGLPLAAAMKLMKRMDPDRYPNVVSDQIHYLHVSREFLKRVMHPTTSEDQKLRQRYLLYIQQKGMLEGKKIILTDIASSGSPTSNHVLTKELLTNTFGASDVQGVYLDGNRGPDRQLFLQEAMGLNDIILEYDAPLLQIEDLLSGPKDSIKGFESVTGPFGESVRPIVKDKITTGDVLSRGLSEQSISLLHDIGIRALFDAARLRHRARLADIQDPSNHEVVQRFIQFISNFPIDDLLLSMPHKDFGMWTLIRQNHLIAPRLSK